MASGLLSKGLLSARDREIVIGRTTARAGAEYEWGVHRTVFWPGGRPGGLRCSTGSPPNLRADYRL